MSEIDVFASPEKPLRDLTNAEVEQFARDRVIHVTGILSAAWIKRIADVVDAQTQSTGLQSMKANAWHTDDGMHRIIMNCPVAHIAQQVLDGLSPAIDPEPRGHLKPVRFFYDQMFVKHPLAEPDLPGKEAEEEAGEDAQGHLGNTPWHHDITFWPVDGEQIVSVWIALDETNPQNGGLEFVPGSSDFEDRYQAIGVDDGGRRPFSSNTLKALPAINSATTGETNGDLSAISFDMLAGDVLIFDAKILHGAPPNLSSGSRRGLALRYLGSDVVFADDKYGQQTSMAPFDCYDESLSNGDKVEGYVYPQILPQKIPSEVETRLSGPITPSQAKMDRWLKRYKSASEAASA
jgi:hypothetical protein